MSAGKNLPAGRRPRFAYLRSRPRLSLAAAVFLLVLGALLSTRHAPLPSLLAGFDLGALFYLGALVELFRRAGPKDMRRLSSQQDIGRWGTLWSGVLLSLVVMVALGLELHAGKGSSLLSIAVAAASIVLCWLFMNAMFVLHYAHEYYGSGEGGLDFPGTKEPDYWDFAYFAFVLGMTFQVSDVSISGRDLRRVALAHSMIAFFFNVFIIALSVNIVAGQA